MTRPFPTIEISDPQFEHDGLRHVTVFSRALGRRADCTLWVPEGTTAGPLPLVVLLHGVYASHWAWALSGGAHRAAGELIASGSMPPCVLAMPSDGLFIHGSGYLDHSGGAFEQWIVEEIPQLVAIVTERTDADARWAVVGLSMGGFGALTLGARHGDRVAAAAGMSSITDFDQMELFVRDIAAYDVDPAARSVLGTILAHRDRLPAISLDCGEDDLLIEHNRSLHAGLVEHGIAHEWNVHPGGHSWEYWQAHVGAALEFCARHLG